MTDGKRPIPKPTIPKPTIRETPSVKPPVTSVDMEVPKEVEAEEEVVTPVSTVEGVETDLVKRFLGVLIDVVIAAVIGSILGWVIGSDFVIYLVMGLVMLVRDSLPILEGQSFGKKMMKIKAVKEDGSSLSGDWATGATRNILLAIPFVGIAEGFVFLSRSGNPGAGLRLGDDWAKTKVISVE